MTPSEWARIVSAMVKRWPTSDWLRNPKVLDQALSDLADLPGAHVGTAVDALHRDGREFAPNAGQIRAKLVDLSLDAPDWSEVRRALNRRSMVNAPQEGCELCGGSTFLLVEDKPGEAVPCECREQRRERARQAHHPLVAAFLAQVGAEALRDLYDPVRNAQARDQYREFVARASEDGRLEGIDSAALRRIGRVNGEPRSLDRALRQALPQPPERTSA